MTVQREAVRPVLWLVFLALAACAMTLLSGLIASLVYTDLEPMVRSTGLTLQHLRPIHETYAFAWVFLGGVATVYFFMIREHGALPPSATRRAKWQAILWAVAGAGILISILSGRFTGREYLGYSPAFSLLILTGWLLFAWNYFSVVGFSLHKRPAYVYMWSVGIILFVITYGEAHLYLIDAVSDRPLRDLAIQWRSNGIMVGAFNQLGYGALMYIGCCIRKDDSYAFCRTAFALFFVGVLNTFTNFGHHSFHLPQSPWIHWIAFVVSMLEVIILAKVFIDFLRLMRAEPARPNMRVCDGFVRSAGLWVFLMLVLALIISVPPINALIHGTHVVVAHSMGSMLGINTMILLAVMAYIVRFVAGADHVLVQGRRISAVIPAMNILILVFWIAWLANGMAMAINRLAGPAAPDSPVLLSAFPALLVGSGLGLVVALLWIIGWWATALAGAYSGNDMVDLAPKP